MPYMISLKKNVLKNLKRLPANIRERLDLLVMALRESGPSGAHIFQNYSKLGETEYHCHLTRNYVACWRHEKKTIIIEVYYAGSREDAPY